MTWKIFIHSGYSGKFDFDERLIQSLFYQAVVALVATNQVTSNWSGLRGFHICKDLIFSLLGEGVELWCRYCMLYLILVVWENTYLLLIDWVKYVHTILSMEFSWCIHSSGHVAIGLALPFWLMHFRWQGHSDSYLQLFCEPVYAW